MPDDEFVLQCPRCGGRALGTAASLDEMLTCPKCGQAVRFRRADRPAHASGSVGTARRASSPGGGWRSRHTRAEPDDIDQAAADQLWAAEKAFPKVRWISAIMGVVAALLGLFITVSGNPLGFVFVFQGLLGAYLTWIVCRYFEQHAVAMWRVGQASAATLADLRDRAGARR